MRRDKDIIGYLYNDTEQAIREKIAKELETYKSANSIPRWIRVDQAAAIVRGTYQ